MQRRLFLMTPLALSAGLVLADLPKVQTLGDAVRWLDKLEKAAAVRTTGAWPMVGVLEHLSQSIEMSVDGFPSPRSALFQATAGSVAFAFFKWQGRMSHSLDEPIPGAATLNTQGDWRPVAARLRTAIGRFNSHTGALKPHFAYGKLGKSDFALAHAFHIANHQDEIVVG